MSALPNAPQVKLAIVGVSRDCFPSQLTRTRLARLIDACKRQGISGVCLLGDHRE